MKRIIKYKGQDDPKKEVTNWELNHLLVSNVVTRNYSEGNIDAEVYVPNGYSMETIESMVKSLHEGYNP